MAIDLTRLSEPAGAGKARHPPPAKYGGLSGHQIRISRSNADAPYLSRDVFHFLIARNCVTGLAGFQLLKEPTALPWKCRSVSVHLVVSAHP